MPPRTARNPASSSSNPTGKQWYQTLNETEVAKRIDAFIAGADDVVNAYRECPACLGIFVKALLADEKLLEWVFSWRPSFFDAALRLIVLLKDVNAPMLRRRLVENQHHCLHRKTTHKGPTASRTTDAVGTLIDALFTLVSGGLKRGPNPLYKNGSVNKKHFSGRKGKWPHALTDLFPVGLDGTLDALVFWLCVPFSYAPFDLLQAYMKVVRPVIGDALLTGTRRERLAWAILQGLTSPGAVPWPTNRPVPFAPPAGLSIAEELRGSGKMVDPALVLLGAIWSAGDARPDDMPRFFAGLEAQFRGAIQGIPDDALPDSKMEKDTIAQFLCMLSDHQLFQCPFGASQKADIVLIYLKRSARGYRCSGPGCSRRELGGLDQSSDGPTRFQCCANCQITRYCNQTCQRADWEQTTGSHRDVCRVLGRLTRQGVDILGEDEQIMVAYEQLPKADSNVLFQAAASASCVPYNRHLALGFFTQSNPSSTDGKLWSPQ